MRYVRVYCIRESADSDCARHSKRVPFSVGYSYSIRREQTVRTEVTLPRRLSNSMAKSRLSKLGLVVAIGPIGAIVACYRIAQYGWSSDQALKEANDFNMDPKQVALKQFVVDFGKGRPSSGN